MFSSTKSIEEGNSLLSVHSFWGDEGFPKEVLTQIFQLSGVVALNTFLLRVCKHWTWVIVNTAELPREALLFTEHGHMLALHLLKTERLSIAKIKEHASLIDFVGKCYNETIYKCHNESRQLHYDDHGENRSLIAPNIKAFNASHLFEIAEDKISVCVTDCSNQNKFTLVSPEHHQPHGQIMGMQCYGDFLFVDHGCTSIVQWNSYSSTVIGTMEIAHNAFRCLDLLNDQMVSLCERKNIQADSSKHFEIVDKRIINRKNETEVEVIPFYGSKNREIGITSDFFINKCVKIIKIESDNIYLSLCLPRIQLLYSTDEPSKYYLAHKEIMHYTISSGVLAKWHTCNEESIVTDIGFDNNCFFEASLNNGISIYDRANKNCLLSYGSWSVTWRLFPYKNLLFNYEPRNSKDKPSKITIVRLPYGGRDHARDKLVYNKGYSTYIRYGYKGDVEELMHAFDRELSPCDFSANDNTNPWSGANRQRKAKALFFHRQ